MQTSDVKNILIQYMPELIKLIGADSNFGWKDINNLLYKTVEKRTYKGVAESVVSWRNIFDIIIDSENKVKIAILQLDFLNELFYSLNGCLNLTEKKLIQSNIKNILKSS